MLGQTQMSNGQLKVNGQSPAQSIWPIAGQKWMATSRRKVNDRRPARSAWPVTGQDQKVGLAKHFVQPLAIQKLVGQSVFARHGPFTVCSLGKHPPAFPELAFSGAILRSMRLRWHICFRVSPFFRFHFAANKRIPSLRFSFYSSLFHMKSFWRPRDLRINGRRLLYLHKKEKENVLWCCVVSWFSVTDWYSHVDKTKEKRHYKKQGRKARTA